MMDDEEVLKIPWPIYDGLSMLYKALADELAKQHKVVIVDDTGESDK